VNPFPNPRHFAWLLCLALAAFSASFLLCNRLLWTPLERYYFGAYLGCGWAGKELGGTVEIRWLYKTAPRRKQHLALDSDVVAASSNGNQRIPVQLSPAALQEGWTGLIREPEERFQADWLEPFLGDNFYGGESLWMLLLIPLLIGTAMLCFLSAGSSLMLDRIGRGRRRQWRAEPFDWRGPSPSLSERWRQKIARMRFRLPNHIAAKMPKIPPTATQPMPAALALEPPEKPTQPAVPLFDAPSSKRKDGFLWDETKGID